MKMIFSQRLQFGPHKLSYNAFSEGLQARYWMNLVFYLAVTAASLYYVLTLFEARDEVESLLKEIDSFVKLDNKTQA